MTVPRTNLETMTTAGGFTFRVLANDLDGDYPIAIFTNGEVARLTAALECPDNALYSLTERRRVNTRYFNVYRAADGSFCLGKRSFHSDTERRQTQDSQRAIAGVALTFNETLNTIEAQRT